MILYFLLLWVLPVKNDIVLQEHVDLIEYNHYHDSKMNPVLDQIIFYNWSDQRRRFDVKAYRLVKNDSQIPRRYGNGYIVRWHDEGFLREITSSFKRETFTQYDPENRERDYLPEIERLDLKKPIR